jgi:anti-sigma B factor antagonist
MDLQIDRRTVGPWTVVEVGGELDLATSSTLRDRLLEMIAEGADRVAVDLDRVTFMDSSSLGVLVTSLKRVRERQGDLVLLRANGSPAKVLALTGLDRVFEMYDSERELPDE